MKRLFLSVICMMSLLASWAQAMADARISQALNSSDRFELRRVFSGSRQGLGKAQDIVFDTGAGVNVVSTAAAKALGMDVYDVGTRLSGIGEQQGGFAVARELCMGNMKMYNVPFFVVDISSGVDSIDAYMSHLDMIVGVDFMNALGELHVDFENNGLFVPKAQNRLSLEGAGGYFVEGTANGEQVTVNLDIGAGNSVLTYSYFESHKEYITTQCRADTLGSAGVGGVKIELAYVLPSLDFRIAGQGYTFPEIYVSTMPGAVDLRKAQSGRKVRSSSRAMRRILGKANIGMDYFIKFKKVVFNTKDMFVRLFP